MACAKTFYKTNFVSFLGDQGKGREGQVRGDPRRVSVPAGGVEGVHRQQCAIHRRKTRGRGNYIELNIFAHKLECLLINFEMA